MTVVNAMIVLLFATPAVYLLVQYLRGPQKPRGSAIAGIVLCTAVMAAYVVFLMVQQYFF